MPAVLLSPSPAQAYKLKGDVEFKKFVIGETGLWDCALCGMAGYWKVDKPVSVEGVVWNCGLVKVVRECEPMSTNGFGVVGWHCELAMSLTFNGFTDMDCSCGLAISVWKSGPVRYFDPQWHGPVHHYHKRSKNRTGPIKTSLLRSFAVLDRSFRLFGKGEYCSLLFYTNFSP